MHKIFFFDSGCTEYITVVCKHDLVLVRGFGKLLKAFFSLSMLSAMSPPRRRSSAAADDNVYRVANQKLVCTIMIREECSL